MKPIRKAIFPVAGLGTRFLPATKANQKEMLPIVDKPLIQYVVEEAVTAGIDTLIFIVGNDKNLISDHFNNDIELEQKLIESGKNDMVKLIRDIIPPHIKHVYIRQEEPLGLGHAVLCAKEEVGNEPFAVLLADDLIGFNDVGCLSQMVKVYSKHDCSVLGIEQVPYDMVNKYGIIDSLPIYGRLHMISSIVEKPTLDEATSNLAVVGRYILSPNIFEILEQTDCGIGNEIQLTDAISKLLKRENVVGYEFEGKRFDCGSKLGYLKASVEFGLRHPEVRKEFQLYLIG